MTHHNANMYYRSHSEDLRRMARTPLLVERALRGVTELLRKGE